MVNFTSFETKGSGVYRIAVGPIKLNRVLFSTSAVRTEAFLTRIRITLLIQLNASTCHQVWFECDQSGIHFGVRNLRPYALTIQSFELSEQRKSGQSC